MLVSDPKTPAAAAAVPGGYQPQLDGLRGVAILLVLFHHFGLKLPGMWDWGPLGVRIFFVLSGYLITLSLWKLAVNVNERGGAGAVMGRFHLRRFVRLAPAFYLSLAVGALIGFQDVLDHFFWHATFLSNFKIVQLGYWPGTTAHFWSLALQEQFYLLWPFVVFFVPAKYFPCALALMVAIAVGFRASVIMVDASPLVRWIMLPAALDSFAAGAFIAWLAKYGGGVPRVAGGGRSVVFVLLLAALWVGNRLLRYWHYDRFLDAFPALLEAVCIAMVLAGTLHGWRGPVGWILQWRPLCLLGKISYGVFVYHLFVRALLAPTLNDWGISRETNLAAWVAILTTASIAVAWVSWKFIEMPISNRFSGRKPYQKGTVL